MRPLHRDLGPTRALGVATLVLALAVLVGPGREARATAAEAPLPQPNIVAIVTDDQEYRSLTRRFMPRTVQRLIDPGTRFTNFIVTTPLCCPSRATHLTGQYGHNNGVLANDPGYPDLSDPENTLPTWLRRAGYTTTHVGKYLNGYKDAVAHRAVPGPGWDIWFTLLRQRYYDYTISRDGETIRKGTRGRDYVTSVIRRKTAALIKNRLSGSGLPFYLQIDHLAPHSDGKTSGRCANSAIPARRDRDLYRRLRLRKPPSFNEKDVSDKPQFLRDTPRLTRSDRRRTRHRYVCRLRSLRAVDRSVNKLFEVLRKTGEMGRTIVFLYSDNGFFLGEHRLSKSKGLGYEEAIHTPLAVRLPSAYRGGASQPGIVDAAVANIDLAPTILDFAGATPCRDDGSGGEVCRVLDGRSFRGLIDNSGGSWPESRPLLIELAQNGRLAGGTRACNYTAVREGGQVLIAHERTLDPQTRKCDPSDEKEHYRLGSDPFQLRNLFPSEPGSANESDQLALLDLLDRLEACAGAAGSGLPEPDPETEPPRCP